MGATAIGPRIGRFTEDGKVKPMPGQSTVFATTGTFILWFGWNGFKTVSTLEFDLNYIAEKGAVTTTLAACAGRRESASVLSRVTSGWVLSVRLRCGLQQLQGEQRLCYYLSW